MSAINFGDLDKNGKVGIGDITELLSGWGSLWGIGNITSILQNWGLPYIPPPTDTTIDQRILPIPRDLSNSVIFTTNFYSLNDLSNNNVPNNLYSSNGIDISYEDVKSFWINKINNSSFNNDIDKGITIVSIQNLNSQKVGAHTLEFINWDSSANGQFSDFTENKNIFKLDNSYNLTPSMELISGIRYLNTISNEILLG